MMLRGIDVVCRQSVPMSVMFVEFFESNFTVR